MTNPNGPRVADLRLELTTLDGNLLPLHYPAEMQSLTVDTLRAVAQTYIRQGQAQAVKVQRHTASGWQTIKLLMMRIKETD
jgi:hypothetical protein